VTTDSEEIADGVRRLRHHGIEPRGDFEIRAPGTNYRLSDVLCALGLPQLRRLPELLVARERVAALYEERLAGLVETPSAAPGDTHGWQAYVVALDRRDEALAALRAQGIEAQIGTYALHRLEAYAGQGEFPGADACFRRALALPFHTRMGEPEVDRVVEALRPFA
jgi:perosamine synthetase